LIKADEMTPIIFKAANHFLFLMTFKYVYEMVLEIAAIVMCLQLDVAYRKQ